MDLGNPNSMINGATCLRRIYKKAMLGSNSNIKVKRVGSAELKDIAQKL